MAEGYCTDRTSCCNAEKRSSGLDMVYMKLGSNKYFSLDKCCNFQRTLE